MKKDQIRKQIWDLMEERGIARFPDRCMGEYSHTPVSQGKFIQIKDLFQMN